MSPCSSDYIFSNRHFVGIWHIVSEDSSRTGSETSGAEAPSIFAAVTARLKSCPSTNLALRAWSVFLLAFPADYLHPSHCHLVSSSVGYSDLPAYSQILLRLANTNLRTVIVTAAVHWGFSSKLHLAVDLSL